MGILNINYVKPKEDQVIEERVAPREESVSRENGEIRETAESKEDTAPVVAKELTPLEKVNKELQDESASVRKVAAQTLYGMARAKLVEPVTAMEAFGLLLQDEDSSVRQDAWLYARGILAVAAEVGRVSNPSIKLDVTQASHLQTVFQAQADAAQGWSQRGIRNLNKDIVAELKALQPKP